MLTAKQPAGIASQARTLTSPHFIFRVAKEATQKKFGRVWQPVSALKMPTFLKEKPLALQGHVKARWPCSEAAPKGQEGSSSPSCGGGGGSGKTRQRHVSWQLSPGIDELPMNVIKWQKIYFFINLDIYEVWMAKFLDILAAPLLHGMLNVCTRW